MFEGAMGGGEGGTGLPVEGRGGGSGQEFLCLLTTWPLPTSPRSAKQAYVLLVPTRFLKMLAHPDLSCSQCSDKTAIRDQKNVSGGSWGAGWSGKSTLFQNQGPVRTKPRTKQQHRASTTHMSHDEHSPVEDEAHGHQHQCQGQCRQQVLGVGVDQAIPVLQFSP